MANANPWLTRLRVARTIRPRAQGSWIRGSGMARTRRGPPGSQASPNGYFGVRGPASASAERAFIHDGKPEEDSLCACSSQRISASRSAADSCGEVSSAAAGRSAADVSAVTGGCILGEDCEVLLIGFEPRRVARTRAVTPTKKRTIPATASPIPRNGPINGSPSPVL